MFIMFLHKIEINVYITYKCIINKMDVINRLTEKIDNYADGGGNIWVGTAIHETLWDDLNDLRNFIPVNKANVMREWKYKRAFECTESSHLNENKTFELMNWEQSFCVTMLFMHYH